MTQDIFAVGASVNQSELVAGVDEVGRGPLAGPVVAAAVILPAVYTLPGLNDSKKVSPAKRLVLNELIKDCAIAWSVGAASVEEIDHLNILHATMLAMRRAVESLAVLPQMVLIDGNRCPELDLPARAIVGGDGQEPCISAASIIAKVHRDLIMSDLDALYPGYGFKKNSGYPTKEHRLALESIGVTPIHRTSFAPVANCLRKALLSSNEKTTK